MKSDIDKEINEDNHLKQQYNPLKWLIQFISWSSSDSTTLQESRYNGLWTIIPRESLEQNHSMATKKYRCTNVSACYFPIIFTLNIRLCLCTGD